MSRVRSKKLGVRSKRLVVSMQLIICSIIMSSCATKDTKFQQYYIQGEQLYKKNCSNCHQKNGKGLGLVYPPLDKSDYLDKNFEDVLCLTKYGKKGELLVNGEIFNKAMPGTPALTDLEVAEIATYIYDTWDRQHGIVEVTEASKILKQCAQ